MLDAGVKLIVAEMTVVRHELGGVEVALTQSPGAFIILMGLHSLPFVLSNSTQQVSDAAI
jgi:hypothetical protein